MLLPDAAKVFSSSFSLLPLSFFGRRSSAKE
jgi:hypothetical protein